MTAILPHNRQALEGARFRVISVAKDLIAEKRPLPPVLVEAVERLVAMEGENLAFDDERRRANLAEEVHYVAEPGDRKTLCGAISRSVRTGYVGLGGEFLQRALTRGQNICPACLQEVQICAMHGVIEPFGKGDRRCGECLHVFKPGELLAEHNVLVRHLAEMDGVGYEPAADEAEVFACPLCAHDL